MLTIEVEGQLEERLKKAAESSGTEPQEIARQVLEENIPKSNKTIQAIFAEWEAENATIDPAELERRQQEGEQLMRNLAANHLELESPLIARQSLGENVAKPNRATLAFLAEWEAENATTDPAELERRQQEGEQLMRNLARNRVESEGPLARKLWG